MRPKFLRLDDQHAVNLNNVFAINYVSSKDNPGQGSIQFRSASDASVVIKGEQAAQVWDYLNQNPDDLMASLPARR
jgi:hypothetical protein